jgi:hypothetical protein
VLVNDIWGAELLKGGPAEWDSTIWDHDLDKGCGSCGSPSTPTSVFYDLAKVAVNRLAFSQGTSWRGTARPRSRSPPGGCARR